jgi:hypothetical protein
MKACAEARRGFIGELAKVPVVEVSEL